MPRGPKPKGTERGSDKCNRINLKITAVICLLANLILTLTFLVLIIVRAVVSSSLTMPQESLTCFPCDTMKSNANTNLRPAATGHSAIKQRDNGMCCGPVESITQMFFQTEMAAQYPYSSSGQSLIDIAEEYADCERQTDDNKPIAKAVGIVEFKPSYTIQGHHKILWNKNGRTFNANNCIHLELEGELFIRLPGYYIVSSQLNLQRPNETDTPINETRPTTFIHHVDLLSHKYGTTGVLMQTKKSIERNGVYFTSFISAVFKLNKYDRLSVSISQPELLDIDNVNDHFLVYYTYDMQF
ncbi:uncharacterized protein LOC128223171 [Mya arenaria]|uniref:uncharacterized protein LOC128223171 n=1 Tax=Mya arenaria TaxID=6604 RepID=UPI0022E6B3DB|nr:uncharacterized protein LOC128223171 [Mya arenaria]